MRRNFCGTKGVLVTGGVNVSAIRERMPHECLNKEHRAGTERCSRLSGGKNHGGMHWFDIRTFSNCGCRLMKAHAERLV